MLCRRYDRKIEIYLKTFVNDGYGGQLPSEELLKSIWASIKTNAGTKFVNFGIQDFKNPVIFSIRGRKNGLVFQENMFVKYQGKEFYVKGIENLGLEEMETNLYTEQS